MKTATTALFAVLLAACVSTARVTTDSERHVAHSTLNLAEVAINAAWISGNLKAEDHQRVLAQLADLRSMVDASATTPIHWDDVVLRVANFGLAWIKPKAPPE